MGCGSSTPSTGESDIPASALAIHLADCLGLNPAHAEIQRYVSALNAEGWDLPDDLDNLTIEELKKEPFSFKPGHLKKVRESCCNMQKKRLYNIP